MYCTIEYLRRSQPELRLIEATDDVHPNGNGEFGTDIANEMIELACGIIDGFLAKRLALPLPMVPLVIKSLAVDLTLFKLYERVGAAEPGTAMAKRKDDALKLLEKIGDGKVSLGLPAAESATVEPSADRILVSSGRAEFTMDSMASLGGGARLFEGPRE